MLDLAPLFNLGAFQEIESAVRRGEKVTNLGLPRAARLTVVAGLYQRLNSPILLLTDRADHALTLLEELGLWLPDSLRLPFPEPNALFYEQSPWGVTTRRDRLKVLTTLASYLIPGAPKPDHPPIIIAPARAVITRTMPRREFIKAIHILRKGQAVQPDVLVKEWVSLAYKPVSIVTSTGEFARRGGILDIWPVSETQPIRLDFFGDELETLRCFDPATQRTTQTIERFLVAPAREYLTGETPELASGDEPETIEFHIPLLHPSPASVLDYLPPSTTIFIDDAQAFQETINHIEEQALNLRAEAVQNGSLSPDFPLPYLPWEEISETLAGRRTVPLGPFTAVDDELAPALRSAFSPGERFGGRLKLMFEHISNRLRQGDQVTLVSRQSARLQDLWYEMGAVDVSRGEARQHLHFLTESLSEGWVLSTDSKPQQYYHLLTDGEIFGWSRPQPRKRSQPAAQSPEAPYTDLELGDHVVHVDHGIGIFLGLVNRTIEGLENEYFCIEYAEGDQLYVPVYQADRLTRYVGTDGRSPALSRLGSPEWRNAKSRVTEAVKGVAEDLLELYARRYVVNGFAFNRDHEWQQELEASFPYVETDDQLRVLADVKKDMESLRPMDRLICGDVGYGKTEIALRAAFKCVMDGKQAVILVPTTVLAQQHYQTFRERLSPFPVRLEMLSRFRSPQEQNQIIKDLAQGSLDIVIGTHRLLSSDVSAKDLGLLIIDEEQRFGVTHKEKLKQMRTEVDVLTLTATPIPRTLYMALTGVRDISTLNTPPAERLPIITHVGSYDPRLVRQAILRELERGGQVFFVHNRVQTIGAMRQHLEKLVPEARIAVAHGQLAEQALSSRMEAFSLAQVDVLLTTSIIESGLDIPNANTLIVDRADTFGLAQLYQLRGRVGRGAQRAYAYFFRHKRILPTPEGRMRLETLAENTQLGAGFSIAMRDLEIRGAGDLLGTRQHGHIATVGFHLYTRLLADAVKKINPRASLPEHLGNEELDSAGILTVQRPSINVDLPIPISIPASYVVDKHVRQRLYRRIADIVKIGELDNLLEEFRDRFGEPPASVRNLLYQIKIKLLAEQAGLLAISHEKELIGFRFPQPPDGQSQRDFPPLGSDVRVGKNGLWFVYKQSNDWQNRLVEILESLIVHRGHEMAEIGTNHNQALT